MSNKVGWRDLGRRPRGITIIAILIIIGAIFFLATGVFLIIAGIFILYLALVLYLALGILYLAFGLAYLVVAYGLWVGKGWAWTSTVVLSIIGIVASLYLVVTGDIYSVISVIINGIIIWYITKSTTRAYFGKVKL